MQSTSRSRRVRLFPFLGLLLALGMAFSGVGGAYAQSTPDDDEDAGDAEIETYTAETFGYSFEYDPELWEITEENSDSGQDFVQLALTESGASLTVVGREAEGDALECVELTVAALEDSGTFDEFEIVEEADGDEEEAVALISYEDPNSGGTALAEIACVVPSDEVAVTIVFEALEDDFDGSLDERDDVVDTLAFADEDAAEDDDASAEADATGETDEDATEEADETEEAEDTPDADETEEATEDADETEEATEEADETEEAGEDDASGDLETYVAETYGYTFRYDPEVWNLVQEGSSFGEDNLVLNNEFAALTIYGYDLYPDALTCVEERLELIENAGLNDLEVVEEIDGDEESATVLLSYVIEQGTEEVTVLAELECFTAGEDDLTIAVIYEAPEDEYDTYLDARDDVVDSFSLEGEAQTDDATEEADEDADPTEEVDEDATEEATEETDDATEEADDATAIVVEDDDDAVVIESDDATEEADEDATGDDATADADEDDATAEADEDATAGAEFAPGDDVLIEDDFEDEDASLFTTESTDPDNVELTFDDGQFVVGIEESEGLASSNTVAVATDETIVSVDAEVTSDEGSLVGIMCRVSIEDGTLTGGYVMYVDPVAQTATLGLIQPDLQPIEALAGDTFPDIIEPGDAVNELELRCEGDTIEGYVNGELVVEVEDDTYEAGVSGVWVATYSDVSIPVEVRFDDFALEGVAA